MQKDQRLELTLSNEKTELTVTFPGESPFTFKLDAEAADELLRTLGLMRAQMQPRHPERVQPGKIAIADEPGWQVDGRDETLLHVRDGRYGWLHYRLSPDTARRMGAALKKD